MIEKDKAREIAADCVARAIKAGATAADAIFVNEQSTDVQVRLGLLEDVQRSESTDLGLRVFDGTRHASVSTNSFDSGALDQLAERAVAMARLAPEDEFAQLAPHDRLYRHDDIAARQDALELYDSNISHDTERLPEILRADALAAEEAARAVKGITNSEGGSASAGSTLIALATSTGFAASYNNSIFGISASVLAGKGADMQRDYAYRTARHYSDLEAPAIIGQRAGQRAVARMNPRTMASGVRPIIFDPRVAGSLIGHLLGAISGASVARKSSFLQQHLGKAVCDSGITIIDDPLHKRGLRSRLFDGEGVTATRKALIDKGVLTSWLLNMASAAQLGVATNGHASRGIGGSPGISATNVHMQAGPDSPAALMADIKEGVYVTELAGQGVNAVTGDYSRGASGFAIRDGQLAEAVSEITIAGNLLDMFMAMSAANDLEMHRAINTPTLRVDGMTIAGQ